MRWIWSQRPFVCGLAVLVTVYAYKLAGVPVDIATCACVYMLTSSPMVWNDWWDRLHDAQFKKTFALEQGTKFLWYGIGMWGITFVLIVLIGSRDWQSGLLAVVIALAGLLYSYTRVYFLLPEITVAAATCSVALFPLTQGHHGVIWYLFLACGLLQLARENIKNTDHPAADRGWKQTVSALFGNQTAIIVARFMIGVAVMMGLLVSAHSSNQTVALLQASSMLAIALAGYWLMSNRFAVARFCLDLGSLGFLSGGIGGIKHFGSYLLIGLVAGRKAGTFQAKSYPEWTPATVIQPRWTWPAMITLLFLVMAGLRLITATANVPRIFLSGSFVEAIVTGGGVVAIFLILFFNPKLAPAKDNAETRETPGYRIVKRMSGGLLLGVVCCVVGNTLCVAIAVMAGIAIISTIWLPSYCWEMKQRGFQLGAIMGFALVGGLDFALAQFLPAYALAVIFYYVYNGTRKQPGSGSPPDQAIFLYSNVCQNMQRLIG